MKRTPPCPRCLGDQEAREHATWQDCQQELTNEDLRSPARRYRPRSSGIASLSWSKGPR